MKQTQFIVRIKWDQETTWCPEPGCCGPRPKDEIKIFTSRSSLAKFLLTWRWDGRRYSSLEVT